MTPRGAHCLWGAVPFATCALAVVLSPKCIVDSIGKATKEPQSLDSEKLLQLSERGCCVRVVACGEAEFKWLTRRETKLSKGNCLLFIIDNALLKI